MKIISQNRQQIINLEQVFKVSIEDSTGSRVTGSRMPQIVATSANGVKACLGIYMPKEAQAVLEEMSQNESECFQMPRSQRYSGGRPLSANDINAIVNNFSCTKHSLERMVERGLFDELPPKDELQEIIKSYIENCVLAFWNDNGTASIAIDSTHYFVVQYVYSPKQGYLILTYNDTSINGYTIFDKQRVAKELFYKKENA